MLVTGVELEDVREIVRKVSTETYGGHLDVRTSADLRGKRASRCRFTIVLRGEYPKGYALRYRGLGGPLEKRVNGACWHAHREVLRELFAKHPDARVKTAYVDYRGRQSFEENFEATGYLNIGSQVYPLWAREACNCGLVDVSP